MAGRNGEQFDTSWAAIDSAEDQVFTMKITDFHGEGLDSDEQEQIFSKVDKVDFERDLQKVNRKVRR